MHLGVGHKSYKAHKTSLALMLLALALFVVAALLTAVCQHLCSPGCVSDNLH